MKTAAETERAEPASRRSSDAADRARRGWRRAGLAPALAAGMFAGAALAQDRNAPCDAACRLAQNLIEGIPAGQRVALLPFGPPETGIPAEVAADLYDRIAYAMFTASNGRHVFVGRDRDDEIWESWQSERERSDFRAFWERRRVGVAVHCKDRKPRGRGIALNCTAAFVGAESTPGSDVFGGTETFPVDDGSFRHFQYRYTLENLGHKLAEKELDPKEIAHVFVIDGGSGERTALTGDIGERIRDAVNERFEARRRSLRGQANLQTVMGRDDGNAATPRGGYELRGTVAWMDDRVASLRMSLRDGGAAVATVSGDIERPWLPERLATGDTGAMRYAATARVVVSDGLGKERAGRAAMNLARARVAAKALGVAPPMDGIRSGADGMAALKWTLERGIPVDERFQGPWNDADGGRRVRLDARFIELGSAARPAFEATLSKDDLRAGEDIRIALSATDAVHAAVFAWGADGKVIRLYPNPTAPELSVPAGGRVALPREGEGRIVSAPLPGNAADREAIVVIVSGKRLEFDERVKLAGGSVEETMAAAVSGGRFFETLGRLDLSRAGLAFLPYRVRTR